MGPGESEWQIGVLFGPHGAMEQTRKGFAMGLLRPGSQALLLHAPLKAPPQLGSLNRCRRGNDRVLLIDADMGMTVFTCGAPWWVLGE